MAQNAILPIPAGVWTLITDSDISAASWVNAGPMKIWVTATIDTTAPTSFGGAWPYEPGMGECSDRALSILWPGLTGRDRLWAYSDVKGQVTISHA